jgi:hypothetical protein
MSRLRVLYFQRVPVAPAPRAGFTGLLYSILGLLVNMNVINPVDMGIQPSIDIMLNSVDSAMDYSEHISSILYKHKDAIPILITGDTISPLVVRAKNELAENSKRPSFMGVFPESGHNDIEAWRNLNKKVVILFRTGDKIEDQLLDAAVESIGADEILDIKARGNALLTRLIWPTWIIGLASVQLGHLLGINPEEIKVISHYKKRVSGLFL